MTSFSEVKNYMFEIVIITLNEIYIYQCRIWFIPFQVTNLNKSKYFRSLGLVDSLIMGSKIDFFTSITKKKSEIVNNFI